MYLKALRVWLLVLCVVVSAHAGEPEFVPTPETRIAPGLVNGDGLILAPFCVKPGANKLCEEAIFYKLTARKSKNSRMVRDRFSFESIDKTREYHENGTIYQYTAASGAISGGKIKKTLELFQGKLEQAGYRVLIRHFKRDEDERTLVGPLYNYLWFAPISGGLAGLAAQMVVNISSNNEAHPSRMAFQVGIPVMTALFIYGVTDAVVNNARAKRRAKHYEENLTEAIESLFSSVKREPVRTKEYIFRDVLGFIQSDFWGWYAVSATEEE